MLTYKLKAVIQSLNDILAFRLQTDAYSIDMTPNEVREQLIKNSIKIDKIQLSSENELFYNLEGIERIDCIGSSISNSTNSIFVSDDTLNLLITNEIAKKQKRIQYNSIIDYIEGKHRNHEIYALYGLRRTGKTVLLLQACKYCIEKGYKVAYATIPQNNSISYRDINIAIQNLIKSQYKVLVIDEITYMKDFIGWSNILSDIVAKSGIRVIIAGTQSFALYLASKYELLDRVYLKSTTYISYKEFVRLLGNKDTSILDYIRYGGVLGYSRHIDTTYIESAIIDNIENTLRTYSRQQCWPKISEALETGTLHTYVYTVINSITKSGMLRSIRNIFRDHNLRSGISFDKELKSEIDIEYLEDLRIKQSKLIGIKDSTPGDVIGELLVAFNKLEVTVNSTLIQNNKEYTEPLYNQPGLRYAQVVELLDILFKKSLFDVQIDYATLTKLKQKVIEDLEGRLIEDAIVVHFIQRYSDKYKVYKLRTTDNKEIDIIVQDKQTGSIALIEVKRSNKIVDKQYRWLIDESITNYIQSRLGQITDRYVLYNGKDRDIQLSEAKTQILYRNTSDFLLSGRE